MSDESSDIILFEGPLIRVTARDGLVSVVVENREDADAEAGAHSALRMAEVIESQLLVLDSKYRALLLDVRSGPPVFGPKTKSVMERLLRRAESMNVLVGVVVANITQRMQFDSLCGIYAPGTSAVFVEKEKALGFLTTGRLTRSQPPT